MMRGTGTIQIDDGSTDVEEGTLQYKGEGMYVIEGLKRLSKTARVAVMHRNAKANGGMSAKPPSVITERPRGKETQGSEEPEARDKQEDPDMTPRGKGADELKNPTAPPKSPTAFVQKLATAVNPRLVKDVESGSAGAKGGTSPRSRQRKRSAEAEQATSPRSVTDKFRRATNKLATNARLLDRAAGRRQDGARRVLNRRVDVDVMRSNDFLTTLRSEYSYSVWKDRYATLVRDFSCKLHATHWLPCRAVAMHK
jgi:hypothetical protein